MSHRRMRHLKPTEIGGCSSFFDASVPTSLYDATSGGSLVGSGGSVARMEDLSGNGRHALQATSLNRPVRAVADKGGLDALDASAGSSVHLQTSSFYPSAGAGDVTILSISNPTSAAYSVAWEYGNGGQGQRASWCPRYASSNSAIDFFYSYAGRSGSPVEAGSWHLHCFLAASATTISGTLQRVNTKGITLNYSLNPSFTLNIGTSIPLILASNGDKNFPVSRFAVFVSFASALPVHTLIRLETALCRKWRIAT